MAAEITKLTVEEFWQQFAGKPYELVDGEVVEIVPTGYEHGSTVTRIVAALQSFVSAHRLGDVVTGEIGFHLADDVLRAADVAFISAEKLRQITEPARYLPFAPDLAVEVVSPGDSALEIQRKVRHYLDAGTRLVWVFYPQLRSVSVHYPDGRSQSLGESDKLDGGDVLPGFSVAIAGLFPARTFPESE